MTAAKGGVSGGTAASMLLILEAAASDRALRRLLADPYGLSPDRANDLRTDGYDRFTPRWDGEAGGWAAPWVMAAINARVVRRSNALLGHRYGKSFRYQESMLMRGRVAGAAKAIAAAAGMGLGTAVFGASTAARRWAERKLPSGQGPTADQRETGFFKLRMLGVLEGDTRATLEARIEGRGDPGYAATSRMIGESAMCLALDPPQPGFEGGVLTPATAMGMRLVERLRKRDFTFDVTAL